MGISGLLPLLKEIQTTKHLSEYSGQTLAVDAYVWLHRGVYGCAPELATGKKTTKYVDYAMHRVRLLRHHGILPYIVFDGGPLPAKKGTESERKKRRDENLARANTLAAQGKHSQAREYYVKCIDVTPQMAYQLIKALRAEGIPYVVAPYEADAQLAYMEKLGLVEGIITEDSDLLVFGCQTVLFKLDATSSTITCVSRADFASVTASAPGGISFLGWSDVEFRSMAILSGCDYLPSIPGVGLKTAWALLRKHKTVENVVRAVNLEGKKKVPKGYLEAFRLAEQVFLYQRVYDPTQERLVHLTELPHEEDWNEEKEAYVGAYIEPVLAKQVAEGDACPINLLPMEDINPTYVPRALKGIPMQSKSLKCSDKDKGKGRLKQPEKPLTGGLLSFFTPKSNTAVEAKKCQKSLEPIDDRVVEKNKGVGRSSGKRTLVEVMDEDIALKRVRQDRKVSLSGHTGQATSRFFGAGSTSTTLQRISDDGFIATAGPSRHEYQMEDKENVPCIDDDEDIVILESDPDPVVQEDGYMTPSPSLSRYDTPELSSPQRPNSSAVKVYEIDGSDDFGADVLSSPPTTRSRPLHTTAGPIRSLSRRKTLDENGIGRVLVRGSPPESKNYKEGLGQGRPGPDLRAILWDRGEEGSDIECADASQRTMRTASSSSLPDTPDDSGERDVDDVFFFREELIDGGEIDELEEVQERTLVAQKAKVASGWWEKWARSGTNRADRHRERAPLRRRETMMTPDNSQRALLPRPASARGNSGRRSLQQQDLRPARGRSLLFPEEGKDIPKRDVRVDGKPRPGSSGSDETNELNATVKNRLEEYRWTGG